MILASDASPVYGFGASVCACTQEDAAKLGGLSERRGDFVRLRRVPGDEAAKDRLGSPHLFSLRKSDFTDVLSIRARIREHSGIMEMRALLISVRWALRSCWRQNAQIVVLVDAKVVIGAASKGRSSSPPLLYVLRQLSGLLFASGVHLRLVYVPSEDNPSDAPSRGKRRRKQPTVERQVVTMHAKLRGATVQGRATNVRKAVLKQQGQEQRARVRQHKFEKIHDSVMNSHFRNQLRSILGI